MPRSRHTDCGGSAAVFLFFLLVFVGPGRAWGWESEDFTLDNGLRVILVRESKAPVVATQVWYRVGALDEVAGKTGLAHMLEHMMFQGTKAVPGGEYSRIIARHGGEENAATAWDHTQYWSRLASSQLELALKLEADRMENLVFHPGRFGSENHVVREERRTRTDSNPQGRYFEKFRRFFFQDHPYGRPIIGWMKDIEGYTLADVAGWYRRHYSPDNAILVIVGDIEFISARDRVRHWFGGIAPSGRKERSALPDLPEGSGFRRLVHRDPQVMAPFMQISWSVPSLAYGATGDAYALDLLAAVLGGGGSSRLYRRLVVQEQKAVAVQTQYAGSSLGVETFDIYADPRDGVPVDDLERALFAEMETFLANPVSEAQLQRAKNGLLAERIYSRDAVQHLATMIGRLSIVGVDWKREIEDGPRMIQEVTAERLQEVAARYLTRDRAVVGVLTP
ncbi:MAG: insulinase family protein [Magnetococcales bacterium]|nr:insulinase family protein [Magnetococcales bacterium]